MLKDIKGFEGLYAIDEDGNVWSYRKNRYLKPYDDCHGYLKVGFWLDGKRYQKRVHRLVLETFNPVEDMEYLEVNHLDECKTNNNLANLEWCSKLENIRYGTGIKRSAESRGRAVAQFTMDGEFIAEYPSMSEAARQTGASVTRISTICRGIGYSAGGYRWRYA